MRMPSLRIGDIEAAMPIIQGGMGVGISLSGLASAVANEGGIGVISSAGIGYIDGLPPGDYREAERTAIRNEIRKTREKTTGVIGINIMAAVSDYEGMVDAAIEAKVDVIFSGAGLVLKMAGGIDKLKKSGVKFVPIVSSGRAAKIIFGSWAKHYEYVPDAVVVEGPKAGGHLGFKKEQLFDPEFALEKIATEVIESVKEFERYKGGRSIPVIAGGGIYTGGDIDKFLRLGVAGVQMGTRFVGTEECDASKEFKDAYIKCSEEDIIIIDSPVGLPGRAISNDFLFRIAEGLKEKFVCPWKCLRSCDFKKVPYCIAKALTNAKQGRLGSGFAFAGANAYMVKSIITVKELFSQLVQEYALACRERCLT